MHGHAGMGVLPRQPADDLAYLAPAAGTGRDQHLAAQLLARLEQGDLVAT